MAERTVRQEGQVAAQGGQVPLSAEAIGPGMAFPVPYAVLRVEVDEAAERATDARYVFANEEFCRAISRDVEGVVGRSHQQIDGGDYETFLSHCYRAVVLGETVRGFWYDPLVRDWTCFSLSPSLLEGHCVYAFMRAIVDAEQRRQLVSTTDARTSLIISDMLSTLAAEQSYKGTMNGVLHMLSEVISADRMSIFECGPSGTTTTFELCAEGVKPQLGTVFPLSKDTMAHWFRNVTEDSVVLVPNVEVIKRFSEPLYRWCKASGVASLMAAPFFNHGEIVGFLGAYNYQMDEEVDLNRLFGAVSTFIAARIDNRQLVDSLRRAGTHDSLTDLLNRRGASDKMERLLDKDPEAERVLALIDMDDFKRVNDVYGHPAGDEALRAMARLLTETFPSDAILSRNGGDEFLVMLSGSAASNSSELFAKLTGEGLVFESAGERHRLTLSVGYARYPEQASSLRELLSKADAALYAVKLSGKQGFGKYTPEAEDHLRLQLGFSARDLLESTPCPLLISRADEEGELLFASTELSHILGYSGRYDLLRGTGGTFTGLLHPDDVARVKELMRREGAREGDASLSTDFSVLTKDGEALAVHASCTFVSIEQSGRALYTFFAPLDAK